MTKEENESKVLHIQRFVLSMINVKDGRLDLSAYLSKIQLNMSIEIDTHYIDIAQARLAHWCKVWHKEASLYVQKQDLPTHITTITLKPKPDVQVSLF